MEDDRRGSCIFGPYAVRAMLDIRRGRFDEAGETLDRGRSTSPRGSTPCRCGLVPHAAGRARAREGAARRGVRRDRGGADVAAGTDDHTYQPEMCAVGARALADQLRASRGRAAGTSTSTSSAAWPRRSSSRPAGHVSCPREDDRTARRGRTRCSRVHAPRRRARIAPIPTSGTSRRSVGRGSEPYSARVLPLAPSRGRAHDRGRGARERPRDRADAWQTASTWAPPLQAAIERLAQRARITLAPRPRRRTPTSHRSSRRRSRPHRPRGRSAGQLARGRTDRQIADELYISKKTVSVHVSNILRKLDAANRIEAGEIGQRAGLGVDGGNNASASS